MSKINITFNNKIFSIDAAALADATAKLEAHVVTMMDEPAEPEEAPSVGLAYTLRSDGASYAVSGIGECTDTKINIPSEHEGLPVTEVVTEAFKGCSNITKMIVPNSVTEIGYAAFSGCSSLESITVPFYGGCARDTYRNAKDESQFFGYLFGKEEYENSYSQSYVCCYYDYEWEEWEDYLVYYYLPISLRSIRIMGHSIPSYGFNQHKYIETIILDDAVTLIDGREDPESMFAFSECSSLVELRLPATAHLPYCFMQSCPKIESIVIPGSVTNIRYSAFYGCSILTNITFNGTMEQWNAITKSDGWNSWVPATHVHCTDGDVAL